MSGAVLTIVSTIVGGGIVGLPYGFYQLGLPLAMAVMLLVAVHQCNTSWLYLNTKNLIIGQPESLYEIGFVLFSRPSIFFISAILVLNSFGLVMVYFIVFSNCMASIIVDTVALPAEGFGSVLGGNTFWVLVLAACMLPVVLMRELQELHIVSLTLFGAVCVFIGIVFL